ncbi:MAG: VCBS repeat-containing protein [Verrucomicrobiota bacterium]
MAPNCASALTNVYFDTFESYPEGTPLVDGTNFWYASDTNVIVQTNNAASGSTNAAMLPVDTTLSNRFDQIASPTNVWLHLEVRPVFYAGTDYPVANTNAAAFFYVNSNGYFVAYDGSASNWVTITQTVAGVLIPAVASNTWVTNLDLFMDYSIKSWQIAQGTNLLTRNLGFANTTISNLSGFDTYNGNNTTTYLDNVYIYDRAPFTGYEVQPKALTNWSMKGTTAAAQHFNIAGTGVRPSDYTIITNGGATWLSVNPGSGIISNGATNVATVSYASAPLNPGVHTSSLSVKTTYGVGSTQTVSFTLNVVNMSFSTNYLSSAGMYGYAPSSQTFNIVMADAAATAFTITTNMNVAWMTVTPGSGTLTNGTNTITVNFSTNGLNVGVFNPILNVVTDVGISLTQQITVAVTAVSRPIPSMSWTNYPQTIQKGIQPATTNLIISNSAATPRARMNYAITSDAPWLLVNTNGLCTNGEPRDITFQFTDMTTNKGLYTGQMTVRTVDAGTGYAPLGQVSSIVQVVVQVLIIGDPGTPGNLTASDGTDTGGIQLSWVATATNVNHYEVWRANTNIVGLATNIAETATNVTYYYDTSVNQGLKRWYWVRAINDYGGAGDFSVPDVGWRFLPAPTGLTATSGTYTNRVALSWTDSLGAVNYEIWRSIYTNVSLASLLGTVSSTVTTYDDTTGDAILTYYYWIRACTPDMGNYSDFASGYRAALMKPSNISASKGTFNSKIRVLWQGVDAATKYEIWRSTDTNVSNALRIGTVTIQGYDDTQASTSQVFYYYWIKAHNAQGFASPYSELDSGWLQLATPANVAATQGTRPYSVRISWNAVENATSYEVVRRSSPRLAALTQSLAESTPLAACAPAPGTGIFSLSESAKTFFDDNATFAGASYLYEVRAKNALGNSELGGEAIGWRQVRQATTTKQVANDYDGDKLADIVLFNPDYGLWRILCTTLGEFPISFGDATCVPVQGDYDGDGLADPMIYSADQSYWRVMMSSDYYAQIQAAFGGPGQLAAAADYDGDRLTDPATYQAVTGMLRVLLSAYGHVPVQIPLGGPGYIGACADYDGDGLADPAVYSASDGLLRIKRSTAEYYEVLVPLGGAGMIVVPGDFDGDGKSELTTYNEATGTLAIKLSSAEYGLQVNLALGGPSYAWIVPGDYDGDGLLDPAAYSQTNGWMIMFSSLEYATLSDTFGGTNNVPFVP